VGQKGEGKVVQVDVQRRELDFPVSDRRRERGEVREEPPRPRPGRRRHQESE